MVLPNFNENPKTTNNGCNKNYVCQYTTMTYIGTELTKFDKLYQFILRLFPAIKRRKRRYLQKLCQRGNMKFKAKIVQKHHASKKSLKDSLKEGDIVKILPYEQIKLALDDKGYCKGLKFQEPMEKYCGNIYKVLKIPEYLLDQGGRKINKCEDVVILSGLTCNGVGVVWEEGCDRSCLHYWKTDWLEKID